MSTAIKGRGAISNVEHRYTPIRVQPLDDGWYREDEPARHPNTTATVDDCRTIISRNQSPDIPFEQSINPYKGCEHGCIYCYARPSHAWLELSPGLDFETKLFYKPKAAELLRQAFDKPSYQCSTITLGANTDPYQPIEQDYRITRQLLEVFLEYRHPVAIITKGSLITRDLDILSALARLNLCRVMVSITTLDNNLKRIMEPRAASPRARLNAVNALQAAGVPVGVMVAPIIPLINDREMENILAASAEAGATTAGFTFVRLPYELKELFQDWLQAHFPQRAGHVMSLVRQSRGGREYSAAFGQRMKGTGIFAETLSKRFKVACRKVGLNQAQRENLSCMKFTRPEKSGQMGLF